MNTIRINLSLRAKLVLAFTLISIFVAGITARGIYTILNVKVVDEFRQRALNTAAVAALQQNGDEFEQIQSAGSPLYEKFLQQNLKISQVDSQIAVVYTVRQDETGLYYVVTAGNPSREYGERYDDPNATFSAKYNSMTAALVDETIYTNQNGAFISSYAPILNSKGVRVGVIGVEIKADRIQEVQSQILMQSLFVLFLGALLGIFFGYVTGTVLAEPIKKLQLVTTAFAKGDLSQRVSIQTGDEVEELGQAFNDLAAQIQNFISELENRVSERTSTLQKQTDELESLGKTMQDRAHKLRSIADVSREIASIQDMDELLQAIVSVVGREFGYYHVGIFINDDSHDYTILRATNSQGGKRMVERGYKLKIGESSSVGNTALTGRPRVMQDAGSEMAHFNNPDLPETRSQVALPLRIGRELIGALDLQTTQPVAFGKDDIELLTVLADQLSAAIQNARLFAETRRALAESEQIYRQYISQQWQAAVQQNIVGAKYTGYDVKPVTQTAQNVAPQVMASPEELSIPIKLRGETIGVISVRKSNKRKWNMDEVDIAQSIADRVAIALENVRLLNEAQRRASKERVIGNIAAKLSTSSNLESVFTLALEELGHIIPGAEIVVQLDSDASKKSPAGKG